MRPVPVAAPATLPVSVAEAKEHGIIETGADDALVERFIAAATDHLDGWSGILGRCLVNQEWRQDYVGWASCLRLPFPNVSTLAVEYIDVGGNPQIVPAEEYELTHDALGAAVQFLDGFARPDLAKSWTPVSVIFTAGYGDANAVPMDIRLSICMLAAHWYDQRSAASEQQIKTVPYMVDMLLAKYRWITP